MLPSRHARGLIGAIGFTWLSCASQPPARAPNPCVGADRDVLADPVGYTPARALEPWAGKDISTRADTEAFVAGFQSRGIPLGRVIVDSPWGTNYTTFVPNPTRYIRT